MERKNSRVGNRKIAINPEYSWHTTSRIDDQENRMGVQKYPW